MLKGKQLWFLSTRAAEMIPDSLYLKWKFRLLMGYPLNLEHPRSFNEKLQWLKLHDRKALYTTLADKAEVKKYVADMFGPQITIPTLGIWNNVSDIGWDTLPERFVLKCTHDSGSTLICRDRASFDRAAAEKSLARAMRHNYFFNDREWPYRDIRPRIIAEPLLDGEVNDYKFFCFNGKVEFFKIDFGRFVNHHANYYDLQGNILPFGEAAYAPDFDHEEKIPANLGEMIAIAGKLSRDHSFIRVDLYNVEGKIYFGELTFYPSCGTGVFTPEEWDRKIGDMLVL